MNENDRTLENFFLELRLRPFTPFFRVCSFQLLELTENYTPEVSEYKVGGTHFCGCECETPVTTTRRVDLRSRRESL